MDSNANRIQKLLRQQTAIASFGSFALRQTDLLKVLSEAAEVCAKGLDAPFSKVCRYRVAENDLLIEAGYGWKAGVVGHVVSRADASSPQGRAFVTGEPSICNDLSRDSQFALPPFYAAHGIVSTVDVVIRGSGRPYGVLEIDSHERHDYDQHDIDFLTAFANVLAEAVATAERTKILHAAIEQMTGLTEEKDRLLAHNRTLAEELQHRVRNNLQLIYGMLTKQVDDCTSEADQRGLKAISRRVTALAQVYDHLLGSELARTTDFGGYLKALCENLAQLQALPNGGITLTCNSEPIILDLDTVTAAGIITAELVSNSYEHAFPSGKGEIFVTVRRDDGEMATIIIGDNGRGFGAATESKRRGLGLVRRLVEQIDGTATIESDHGTVWTIKFPAAPGRGPGDEVRSPAAAGSFASRTLLLADAEHAVSALGLVQPRRQDINQEQEHPRRFSRRQPKT
jgi:two-component sensor histidine kinase